MVRLSKLESEIWQFQIRKSCIPEHELTAKPTTWETSSSNSSSAVLDSADRTYRRTRELLLKLQKSQDSKPLPPSQVRLILPWSRPPARSIRSPCEAPIPRSLTPVPPDP